MNYAARTELNEIQFSVSEYDQFSNPKHKEVEERDDSAIRNLSPFLFFSVPQTIILICIFKWIFYRIFRYQISSFIRKFCFVPCCLLQMFFQGNIAYFTYVCLNNFINCFFSFKFVDKLSLFLSIMFFFFCLIYGICFYFLMNEYYGKKLGYFMDYVYREPSGLLFLTCCFPIRGILRGFVYSLFYHHYFKEILFQCLIEFLLILLVIFCQTKYRIFIKKTSYILVILYHSFFIIFNLSLALEEYFKKLEDRDDLVWKFAIEAQKIAIFMLFGISILLFVIELMPKDWFKKHTDDENLDKQN